MTMKLELSENLIYMYFFVYSFRFLANYEFFIFSSFSTSLFQIVTFFQLLFHILSFFSSLLVVFVLLSLLCLSLYGMEGVGSHKHLSNHRALRPAQSSNQNAGLTSTSLNSDRLACYRRISSHIAASFFPFLHDYLCHLRFLHPSPSPSPQGVCLSDVILRQSVYRFLKQLKKHRTHSLVLLLLLRFLCLLVQQQ